MEIPAVVRRFTTACTRVQKSSPRENSTSMRSPDFDNSSNPPYFRHSCVQRDREMRQFHLGVASRDAHRMTIAHRRAEEAREHVWPATACEYDV